MVKKVGIQNGPAQGDEAKRTPMPWENSPGGGFTTAQSPWHPFAPGRESANVASQIGNPSSLLSHYRNLIRLRKTSQALSHGSIEMLTPASSSSPVLAYLRRSADQLVLVAHNLNDSFVSSGPYRINAISAQRLFVAGVLTDPSGTSGQWNLSMPPHSTGIWVMR